MNSRRLDTARQYATVMSARNGQVRMRLAMPVIIAAIFHPFTGWPLAIAWVATYAASRTARPGPGHGGAQWDCLLQLRGGRRRAKQ